MITRKVITTILISLIFVSLYPLTLAAQTIPLDEAVREGKVQIEISGLGGSTGDTIILDIKRKVPEKLRISLSPGTVFKSTTGNVQNMISSKVKGERMGPVSYRPGSEIYLNTDKKRSYIVEAYCLDFNKPNPGVGDSFTVYQVKDRTKSIIIEGEKARYSTRVIQSAIWIDRAKATPPQLKSRFPVNDNDIETAKRLLDKIKKQESSWEIIKKSDNSNDRKVIITCKIGNLGEAKEYITEDSYLQVVKISLDGKSGFETDSRGRMIYNSDLIKMDIPPNGDFTFKLSILKPGKYIIATQRLEPFGLGNGGSYLLGDKKTKKIAVIEIPAENRNSKINMGELYIPLPNVSKKKSPSAKKTIESDKVHRAQKRLKELGYDSGLIDGILGGKTKLAIKQFQREKGVTVTGISDQRTTKMLFSSTNQSKVESSPKNYETNEEPVFTEKSSLVEHALHLNSLAAWKAFVEQNAATKTEDTWHGLASFVPERVAVIPKAPDFACRAQQMMIGSAKPAPVTPGQKVLLVTYSFTYGKPLWRVAFGSFLLGSPPRPPVHFGLKIEIRVQVLDMGKGTLVDFPSLSAKENTSKRDGAVKDLFKGLAKDLKGASPALLDMIGEAEMMIIQVGQVIDGEKGGIKDDLLRRIALSQITEPDWKMRQRGAEALSRVMKKEDVKVISELLDDKKSWVSRALVREVNRGFDGKGRKWGPEMVPFFRSAMVSEDSWVRAEITKAIGKARIPETRSLILVAAKDKAGTVRRAAASALGQLGQSEGIETLVPMLDDADGQTAKAAAEALKKLGWKPPNIKMNVKYLLAAGKEDDIVALGAPAVPLLMESLQHASENTVATAIGSLGKMGEKRAVEALITSLVGTKSRVRVRSAEALGNIGDRRATVPLMACLKERSSSLRTAAAEALGKIKDVKAVDALIDALEDKNKGTRLAAVKALGAIGDARAAEAVAKLLKDPNGKVKEAAAKALDAFNWQLDDPEAKVNAFMTTGNEKGIIGMGEGAVGPLTAMLADDSLKKRLDAIGLLGKIGSDAKGAIVPISGCLNARNEKEVIAAVKALAKIGDSAASPDIRKALLTHSKVDRASIWMHFALACLNEERDEHIDALVKALSSEWGSIAAQALVEIEFKDEELEIIASNLSSPDPKLRLQAAEIMGKVGTHDATKHLWTRLSQEKDESVRKALRKAIRSLSKKQ